MRRPLSPAELGRLPDRPIRHLLADVCRRGLMRRTIPQAGPDVVFYAAARKPVSMSERDVCAAVGADVPGTANLVETSVERLFTIEHEAGGARVPVDIVDLGPGQKRSA